jgi:hypothetical protein
VAEHAHAEAAPETTAAMIARKVTYDECSTSQQSQIGVDDTQYECHEEQKGSSEAEALWCIPWSDIKVFPLWYASRAGASKTMDERGSTLIHEWMHRYACKLDVGYEWEEGYADASTIRQLANSDPYGMLCFDVRLP